MCIFILNNIGKSITEQRSAIRAERISKSTWTQEATRTTSSPLNTSTSKSHLRSAASGKSTLKCSTATITRIPTSRFKSNTKTEEFPVILVHLTSISTLSLRRTSTQWVRESMMKNARWLLESEQSSIIKRHSVLSEMRYYRWERDTYMLMYGISI